MEIIYTTRIQPDIIFGSVRVCEPVIFLTDLLMCLVCFWAFSALRKHPATDRATWLYQSFFLFMGCSALLSGFLGHLMLHYVPFEYKVPGWLLSLAAVAVMAQASIERIRLLGSAALYPVLTGINIAAFIAASSAVYITQWFPVVEIYTAFGLLGIMGLIESVLWYKLNNSAARLLLLGLPFAMLAVIVHVLHFSIGAWFSFFDIGHVLLCGTFYCFFLGAKEQWM